MDVFPGFDCVFSVRCIAVRCVQVIVERLENEMKDINSNSEALKRNFLDLTELRHILSKTHQFFEEVNTTLALHRFTFIYKIQSTRG